MSRLIADLKAEHAVILDKIEQTKNQGFTSAVSQEHLASLKTLLLAHLSKEDKELYPLLQNAAAKDKNLQTTLDIFAKDTDAISQMASDFFKKYPDGGSGVEFALAVGRLFGLLSGRISNEENLLYKEYDKRAL